MTTAMIPPSAPDAPAEAPGTTAPDAAPPKPRRSRRWLRLVLPPAIVLVLILIGTLLYQLEQPDEDDEAYLSPSSTADIGAATLAGRVRDAGVRIERRTKSSDALVSAHDGNATLLITTPELMHPYYLRMLKLLPSSTTVVVVEPRSKTMYEGFLPIVSTDRQYASVVSEPGCGFAPAAEAGRAAVGRTRYGPVDPDGGRELDRCYDGALVVLTRGSGRIVVVGSADPFRNDRIGEHGNARLATGLLTGAPTLIWLDLHRNEPPPLVDKDPSLGSGPAAPPSLRPPASGEPADPEFPVRDEDSGSGGQPQAGGVDGDSDAPPNPLLQAFPPWSQVAAALLIAIFVALAAAQARRLGGPVVEPLPVVVRATETVSGRGRLYLRARARDESLRTLREAAVARLSRLLRLEPETERQALVEAVAAQSGWPAELVEQTLFGPPPLDDDQLVAAATRLERLADAVAAQRPAASPSSPADASPSSASSPPASSPPAPSPPASSSPAPTSPATAAGGPAAPGHDAAAPTAGPAAPAGGPSTTEASAGPATHAPLEGESR
ncbi:DUF4350 domain-containing protein [Dactylosporangium sucinum]|uniref:DUF4350 domain-containing protein n=1 Tax=Dactylosporangium sucinum TaxID=1424081 RepID=A0A917WVY4_9ACTN|nr:DUF4350 domain-containing protein [Dactylosporangium sucinum]GGM34619.1 hypothetical protein GCM10007977_040120 [Dactylosporangium sucinum]